MLTDTNKSKYKIIIEQAVSVIKSGGIIVMPFDTVYGFVCDPNNDQALEKIFKLKSRSLDQTIGTATNDINHMKKYASIDENKASYIKERTPGPFTFILNALCHPEPTSVVPHLMRDPHLVSGSEYNSDQLSHYCYKNSTLAIRIPDNKLVLDITKEVGIIVQTSANKAGQANCYSLEDLKFQFTEQELSSIDLIIDGGVLPKSKPSTLIDMTKETPVEIER